MSDPDTEDLERAAAAGEGTFGDAIGAIVAQNPEIITLLKVVGIVWGLALVVSSLMRVGRIAEGKDRATYGKAITIFLIGVVMLNFYWLLDVLVQSAGLDSTWRESASICYSASGVSDACSAEGGTLGQRVEALVAKIQALLTVIGVVVVFWGLVNLKDAAEHEQSKYPGFIRVFAGAVLINADRLAEWARGFLGLVS